MTDDERAGVANRLRIALQVREAAREHRRGKPVVFSWAWWPYRKALRGQ